MARTGRFGRLPTDSPDLSSQIVSLMEQWMAAEDRNIVDAWTNGGKYQGKKVNDKDILKHYRGRRNSFEKDDPMWDQWNQDLWQVRFQISDEKVQMQYRTGKIGPSAVAAHYRRWARKMPKNSSYYRNLMATAGDFAKAAKAGGSAGSKGFDYQAMQDRINALDKKAKPIEDMFGALSKYAADRGFIPVGTSILDPSNLTVFEADDLNNILDGVQSEMLSTKEWRDFQKGAASEYPDWAGKRFTSDDINDAVGRYVQIQKNKIATWRKAPYDMSSYIAGARASIRDARHYGRRVTNYLDIGTDLAVAWDIYSGTTSDRVGANDERRGVGAQKEEGMMGAVDPADALSGDAGLLDALRRGRNGFRRNGNTEHVAGLSAVVKVLEAQTDDEMALAVQEMLELDPSVIVMLFGPGSPWANPGDIAAWAQERMVLRQATGMLARGEAAIFYNPNKPTAGEQQQGAAGVVPFTIYVQDTTSTGKTIYKDPNSNEQFVIDGATTVVTTLGSNGRLNPTIVVGRTIYGSDGQEVGWQFDIKGTSMWGRPDATSRTGWSYTVHNPFDTPGASLDDRGDHLQVVIDSQYQPTSADEIPVERNVHETLQMALDTIEEAEDLSPEQKDEQRENIGLIEADIVAGRWDDILNNPDKRAAYASAYSGDVVPAGQYEVYDEASEAANTAFLKHSMRMRFGAELPTTREDLVFIDTGGNPRDSMDALIYWENPNLDQPDKDLALRDRAMAGAPDGTYAERLNGLGIVSSGQSMGYGENAFGGLGDGGMNADHAMSVLEDSPEVENARATGNTEQAVNAFVEVGWSMSYEFPNHAFAMADPNVRKAAEGQAEIFHRTGMSVLSEDDIEGQAAYNQQWTALETLSEYSPAMAEMLRDPDVSPTAIAAGEFLGAGNAFDKKLDENAEALNAAIGVDIPLQGAPEIEVPEITPVQRADDLRNRLSGVERLDITKTNVPDAGEAPVKPQPTIKVSANIIPLTQMKAMQAPRVNLPAPPGAAAPPAPAPQAPAPSIGATAPAPPAAPSAPAPAPRTPPRHRGPTPI